MSLKTKQGTLIITMLFFVILTGSAYMVDISYHPSVGDLLVNKNGMTLYYFSNDDANQGSKCYDRCVDTWKPFYEVIYRENLPDRLNVLDFSTIKRGDDRLQIAYKGWPLYLYIGDDKPGDLFGEGKENAWFIVSP